MRPIFAVVCVLAFALPTFAQESIFERLDRLEASERERNARTARMESDIKNVDIKVDALAAKVDALAKVIAPGAVFQADSRDEWGRNGSPASFAGSPLAAAQYSSYSSAGRSSGRPLLAPWLFPRLAQGNRVMVMRAGGG